MNWYIDNAGAAEGPYDDAAMTALAHQQKLASDSLVWHAGLDAWGSVAAISPDWWGAALPEPAKAPPATKSRKKVSAPEADSLAPKPTTTTTLREQPATTAAPKRRLAAPVAPSEVEQEKESGGLLKKLFGFGKKKK